MVFKIVILGLLATFAICTSAATINKEVEYDVEENENLINKSEPTQEHEEEHEETEPKDAAESEAELESEAEKENETVEEPNETVEEPNETVEEPNETVEEPNETELKEEMDKAAVVETEGTVHAITKRAIRIQGFGKLLNRFTVKCEKNKKCKKFCKKHYRRATGKCLKLKTRITFTSRAHSTNKTRKVCGCKRRHHN